MVQRHYSELYFLQTIAFMKGTEVYNIIEIYLLKSNKSIFYSIISCNYAKIYETFNVMQQYSLEILTFMTYCSRRVYNHCG